MMKAREGRVLFTDLWNGDTLSAPEKEYAARLYEVFFVLPGHVQRELAATGAPPTRAAIAANFGLSVEGVDLLLAVMTGEPDKVAPTLAPEFQILRSDGSNYDAETYPEKGLPIISEMPAIEKLNVTATGDLAVASYVINVDETVDGVLAQAYAPRLSVFRKDGGRWLLVAHGNFAALEQ